MTSSALAAKADGRCTYPSCDQPCSETSVQCVGHAADLAARVRKSTTRLRAGRRARGQCAACGRLSPTYRCGNCKPRQPELPL